MMTVSDTVNLDTPPKNEAAPTRAKAPGSIQAQYEPGVAWIPNNDTIANPTMRPYTPPIKLQCKK